MSRLMLILTQIVLLVTLGCGIIPTGPSVMVLPGTGLSLEQFSKDNVTCQQFATFQVSGTQNQADINNASANTNTSSTLYETQLRYDMAYIQCMYVKGHQVPVFGQFTGLTPVQVTSPYPPIPSLIPNLIPSAKPTQPNHNGLTPTPPKE